MVCAAVGHFEKYHNTLMHKLSINRTLIEAYLFKSPLLEWNNGIQSVCWTART